MAVSAAYAQTTPSLEDVLAQVRSRVELYTATLPNLFCDERFLSQRFNDGHQQETRTTVSTFRVQRNPEHSDAARFRESRMVRQVDGMPAHGSRVQGPYTLDGGFDRALELFTSARICFRFALVSSPDPTRVRLSFEAKSPLPSDCPAADAGRSGTALIEAANRQVLEMQEVLPHPQGGGNLWSPLRFSITFAPVLLGGQTFYTPQTIQTRLEHRGTSEYLQSIAQYSNYHKLEVTSTIVPTPEGQP